MPDIFLSYSRDDQATARRVAEGFERAGFSVWWDQTLNAGEAYDEVTEKALLDARAVAVLWSKKSVASRWVRAEATQAERNKTLVPAMIEPCTRPIMFELTQTADLSSWKGDAGDTAWQAYVASVRRFVERDVTQLASSPVSARAATSKRLLNPAAIALIIAGLVLVGGGIWMLVRNGNRTTNAQASVTQPIHGPVTLAVLPFANLSSDPEQEYFSDGLTEEILNQLAQIKALRVTGRTSSFSFKGKNEDLRTIAEKLGVANLLEGSIRKDGSQLRITAQLINGKSGTHMWSQTYDHELSKVFELQEEIAKDVAKALSITLEVGDMTRAQGGTINLEAYEKFLRAQSLAHRLGPDLYESVRLYREAVKLDPMFWRAWFGLRTALGFIRTTLPEGAVAANKEMVEVEAYLSAAAPDSWAKQVMLARRYFEEHKWLESEAAIESAINGIPASEVDGRVTLGIVLHSAGRASDALVLFEQAARTDPLTTGPSMMLQGSLNNLRRFSEAQVEFERSKALLGSREGSDLNALKRLLMKVDTDPKSVRDFVQSGSTIPAQWAPLLDKLESSPAERKVAVQKMLQDSGNQNVTTLSAVVWFADPYGDRDSALVALQRFVSMNRGLLHVLWLPSENGLRTDSRFKDILRSTGLVDYYRATGNWGDFCKPVGADDFECQ